jgi:hypothetical protein
MGSISLKTNVKNGLEAGTLLKSTRLFLLRCRPAFDDAKVFHARGIIPGALVSGLKPLKN